MAQTFKTSDGDIAAEVGLADEGVVARILELALGFGAGSHADALLVGSHIASREV